MVASFLKAKLFYCKKCLDVGSHHSPAAIDTDVGSDVQIPAEAPLPALQLLTPNSA